MKKYASAHLASIASAIATAAIATAQTASAAHTGTVTASLSQDGTTFTATFANHASETNSLWVVYGASDMGEGTNGWAHVERLGTVTPETNSWIYAAPAGWGDTVKALRFVLSEVPYDYDYSLDFIRNQNYKQRIVLSDFDLYMNYRVCARIKTISYVTPNGGSPAIFSNRDTAGNVKPYFNLFVASGAKWRFDYNASNGKEVSGFSNSDTEYSIVASSDGLYVNGSPVDSKQGTIASTPSTGKLEFFCGNTSFNAMNNPNLRFNLYGVQIYDEPTGGNLIVNLVPMVKDGVAGMYDTVRDKYYYSDIVINGTAYSFPLTYSTRIENANPFFSSALVAVEEEGPTVFTPASDTTDANDYDNHDGGILNGTATLTLSGSNDWGGRFTVSNGTLVAGFGQGLGAGDNLALVPHSLRAGNYGGYGGWNGNATAAFGSGAGQLYVGPGGYWALCAADGGNLTVDVGGEGAPIKLTSDYHRFQLNGASGAGTLALENPIEPDSAYNFSQLIIRTGFGTAALEGNINGADATDPANGLTLYCYDLDTPAAGCDGRTVFLGDGNRFKTLEVRSGTHGFGDGAIATLDGNIYVRSGNFFTTNATVALNGAADYVSGLMVNTGAVDIVSGSFTAAHCEVGVTSTASGDSTAPASLRVAGQFTLDDTISAKAFGSMTVYGSAARVAVTFDDGAAVSISNLNFYRRSINHSGGSVTLRGGSGINDMGKDGASRYRLYGGTLKACRANQAEASEAVPEPRAWFIFGGGTLITPANVQTPFFQDFSGESAVQVQANKTSTFQVDYSTSITNGLVHESGSWNYAAADWLTAPAFVKTGSATLTLSGTSTYKCATDVAQGTLALASGDAPGILPTDGVVRLTGGTLDLGGNAQTVRALLGTAGAAVNGSIAATEGIYPGGAGAVGSFASGAALSGTLYIDVDAETGDCDSIAVPAGSTLDLSAIDLVLPETIPSGVERLIVATGATTGAFRSVANLPSGWEIAVGTNGARARKINAFVMVIR